MNKYNFLGGNSIVGLDEKLVDLTKNQMIVAGAVVFLILVIVIVVSLLRSKSKAALVDEAYEFEKSTEAYKRQRDLELANIGVELNNAAKLSQEAMNTLNTTIQKTQGAPNTNETKTVVAGALKTAAEKFQNIYFRLNETFENVNDKEKKGLKPMLDDVKNAAAGLFNAVNLIGK
jgi:hypothetical protein